MPAQGNNSDITTTITYKGKSTTLDGPGLQGLERQLQLDGMPEATPSEGKKKKEREKNPYSCAFEITPFMPAPEVEALAKELIPEFHAPRWREVPEIIYLFSEKAPKAQGQDAVATCRKIGGINAYLYRQQFAVLANRDANSYNQSAHRFKYENERGFTLPEGKHVVKAKPLFVITWHWNMWQFADESLRRAVTDHELQHVGVEYSDTGDGIRYCLIPHSVQEFDVIVERYGAYASDLKRFQKAMQEGELARRESKTNG